MRASIWEPLYGSLSMGASIWERLYGSFYMGTSICELVQCVTNALPLRYQCVTQCSLVIVFAIETLNRVALEKISLETLYCMTRLNDSITKTMKGR